MSRGSGARPTSSFSAAKLAIDSDASDVNILVIGDSTGDATTEWVYLFAEWLATEYTTHSVSYRLWNDTSDEYDAADSISAGSGANTIHIWNASIGGTQPLYLFGGKKDAAIIAPDPTLVIFNHGHNLPTTNPNVAPFVENNIAAAIEMTQLALPNAHIAFISQNPRRDDDLYEPKDSAYRTLSPAKPNSLFIDVYSRFIAQGKDSSLYSDNVHPSAAGTQLYLQQVQSKWATAPIADVDPEPAWLASTGTNLLENGDFSAFDGAAPDGWSEQGGADQTVSKDMTIVDAGSTYSVKVVMDSGTVQANINQVLSADNLTAAKAAGSVSLAFRRYLPTDSAEQGGLALVVVTKESGTDVYRTYYPDVVEDAWEWALLRNISVPSDTTKVQVYLYADGQANVGATVYLGKAVLVEGDIPRDMA